MIAKSLINNFAADERGATAVEYGLLATLIAVALIGGASVLGQRLNNGFLCTRNGVAGTANPGDGRGPCG